MAEAVEKPDPQPDLVDKMMAWESDQMSGPDTVVFFQHLIDSGLAWQLQGVYGRMATTLIAMGECHR